jgi:branched-chain amino acid aminotransferase
MAIHYVDGQYVDAVEATLPLTDMAILRGYAVFDFLRTYSGKPFHLEEHILRLRNSAALLHISCPWSLEYFREVVNELLCRNNFSEANIRFLVTGGDSDDSITPADTPRLIIMVTELKPLPSEWYSDGVKIITSNVTRHVPGSKSTNYIQAIMALKNARTHGAIESIYVNDSGHLLEGTTSNLFVVKTDGIITPERDILPGITRDIVLRLVAEKFSVEQDVVNGSELAQLTEAFITSSNKEIVPVVQIDDVIISAGPGQVTKQIMTLFRQYTDSWRHTGAEL